MTSDAGRNEIGVVVALLTAAVLAAGCGADARAGDVAEGAEAERSYARVVNVETTTVTERPFTETIRLTGTVAAFRDVVLSAEEPGTVREVLVEKGGRVAAGDPMVRLDDRVLRAQLREAAARADLARETWERNRQLFEEDRAISRLAYLQAKYGSDEAEARRDALARRAERTTIRAPFAGVVESREVEIGSLVAPGTPVLRLVALDTLRIQAGVPERYAADVDVGDPVTVTFDVLGDDRFEGRLTFAGSVVNRRNRTFPVEITLPNRGRRIKPEMVATLSLARRHLEEAVVVPREALVRVEDGFVAFVVEEGPGGGPVAVRRVVQLGPTERNRAVIEEGLRPGDRLVVVGQKQVADGDRVSVVAER